MRKVSILLVVALIATSCAVGTYHPYAQNNFGAQSTVVLDKANFRVVRDVEAIVDVNNTRLSRADVASSAYGELLRKAQLTGSQVLINVVIEEVRRETAGFFRLLFGMPKRVQHVAARATIIEFLDENGKPRISENYRPYNHSNYEIQSNASTTTKQSITNTTQAESSQFQEVVVNRSNKTKKKEKPVKPITINDIKQKVTPQFVQVQQKYKNLGLSKSPINVAYTKSMGYLMSSQSIEDWQVAGNISTLVDNLTEKNCTVDKVSLESQLAKATTPAEIIEVFKKYVQL